LKDFCLLLESLFTPGGRFFRLSWPNRLRLHSPSGHSSKPAVPVAA
jgi:hypothetical protein